MSLDFMLFDSSLGSTLPGEPSAAVSEPSYWFLYPFFESLSDLTGQMADIYGYAEFKGGARNTLLAMIGQAEDVVGRQPEEWLLCTGRRTGVDAGPIFERIQRTELLSTLAALRDLVVAAIACGVEVHAVGD